MLVDINDRHRPGERQAATRAGVGLHGVTVEGEGNADPVIGSDVRKRERRATGGDRLVIDRPLGDVIVRVGVRGECYVRHVGHHD